MPKLSEIALSRGSKKFVKKDYRSWNISGDGLSVDSIPTEKQDENTSSATQLPPPHSIVENIAPQILPSYIDNRKDNELDDTHVTNVEHTTNNQPTDQQHLNNIHTTKREQLDNNKDNDINNNFDVGYYIENIKRLSGIQEQLFNYIIELCCSRDQLETGYLLTSDLSTIANCSVGCVKTSLERLTKKNLLLRKKGKPSRGGYLNLAITREIQTAALQAKNFKSGLYIHRQKSINPICIDNNIDNHLSNSPSYTSSSNKYINTTTELPNEWAQIDFADLTSIGFSHTQLVQLHSRNLNIPEAIQESINHFAFALDHNDKVKFYPEPLNVLMGVLRKGGIWFEKSYRSPREIAQQQLIEQKKAEMERKDNLVQEAYKIAFMEWQQNLTPEEMEKIAPNKKNIGDLTPQSAKLNIYFKERVWSQIKNEYLI